MLQKQKLQVSNKDISIDMPAGPSEVYVVSDDIDKSRHHSV